MGNPSSVRRNARIGRSGVAFSPIGIPSASSLALRRSCEWRPSDLVIVLRFAFVFRECGQPGTASSESAWANISIIIPMITEMGRSSGPIAVFSPYRSWLPCCLRTEGLASISPTFESRYRRVLQKSIAPPLVSNSGKSLE